MMPAKQSRGLAQSITGADGRVMTEALDETIDALADLLRMRANVAR